MRDSYGVWAVRARAGRSSGVGDADGSVIILLWCCELTIEISQILELGHNGVSHAFKTHT